MEDSLTLSSEELIRYGRQLRLPGFGVEGQQRLHDARVLIVGMGGLGSPVALYLAAAGVGTLGLVDFDRIDVSNLQRQVLYSEQEVGQPKALRAAQRLKALNPHVNCRVHALQLSPENALDVLQDYDLVVDGTDNFETRYLLNDACRLAGKPWIFGSIYRFEGQMSVFNLTLHDGQVSPDYRDLFPEPPPPELAPNCAEGGVLGVLPGVIGSMQANEAIKVLCGLGEPLAGQLWTFDALTGQVRTIRYKARKNRPEITKLQDYQTFCASTQPPSPMKEVTVQELQKMKESGEDFQLIDVREPYEREIADIGGEPMPMGQIDQHVDKIARDKKVVVHCRSGGRSGKIIEKLEREHGFDNLYNLKGGTLAWSAEIDPSVPRY
ncbi:adenylyltransferase and sulfurtransferase [Catalinimonas alkaloidigena]|uniref:Molybdopterin-synthase adenylyltransferase n=1 Tax=Catalinimonas alkaloidigena TaxID=1075417 RepID=A0A1G9F7M8_9BACT|nr:molybdopterin-synthase adenylyltransferase MoeB [Catalinimonas alkaloidigena]SDK84406.1 adenylyltransferase and sulfurtransferase [Catalinimonas alkaloidigena]